MHYKAHVQSTDQEMILDWDAIYRKAKDFVAK